MNSKYEVKVKGLSGITAPRVAKEKQKELLVRGYNGRSSEEAKVRMEVTMTGLGESMVETLHWETMYIRETLLDYSYCWGLSMGETVEYLAGHNLGIGYKELMVDRIDRWMKEQYMSEESASEPSELSR